MLIQAQNWMDCVVVFESIFDESFSVVNEQSQFI